MRRAAKPYRYGLLDRLEDSREARRHGKHHIPAVWPPSDQPGEDWTLADDAAGPSTIHIDRLHHVAGGRWEGLRRQMLEMVGGLEASCEKSRLHAENLHWELEAAQVVADKAEQPLTEAELNQRHPFEHDLSPVLVRKRRRNEHERRQTETRDRLQQASSSWLVATQQAAGLRREARTLRRMAAAEARRIEHHYQRRCACYWSRLVLHHQHGPWINNLLRGVGPQLPVWVRDIELAGEEEDRT